MLLKLSLVVTDKPEQAQSSFVFNLRRCVVKSAIHDLGGVLGEFRSVELSHQSDARGLKRSV